MEFISSPYTILFDAYNTPALFKNDVVIIRAGVVVSSGAITASMDGANTIQFNIGAISGGQEVQIRFAENVQYIKDLEGNLFVPTAADKTGVVLTASAAPAAPAAGSITVDYAAETTVQIIPVTQQYRAVGSADWITGSGSKVALTPGINMEFRNISASGAPSGELTLTVPARPATPTLTLTKKADGSDNVYVINTATTNSWSIDGGATWNVGTGSAQDVVIPLTGATVELKTVATVSAFDSLKATKTYAAQAAAPAMPAITYSGSGDVYVIGASMGTYEHSIDGTSWTAGNGAPQNITLAAGTAITVSFRVAATNDVLASASATKVYAAPAAAPTFVAADSSADKLTGLPANSTNLEARLSTDAGATWSAWTDLVVTGTEAPFTSAPTDLVEVRVKATNDVLPSAAQQRTAADI